MQTVSRQQVYLNNFNKEDTEHIFRSGYAKTALEVGGSLLADFVFPGYVSGKRMLLIL
jgi:hypothetical protein